MVYNLETTTILKTQKLDFDLFEAFMGNTIIIEGLSKEGYANNGKFNSINADLHNLNESYKELNKNLDLDDPNYVSKGYWDKRLDNDMDSERIAELKKNSNQDEDKLK